jgi:hypothetical protein
MRYLFTILVVSFTLVLFGDLTSTLAAPRKVSAKAFAKSRPFIVEKTRLRAKTPVIIQRVSRSAREVRYANVEVINVGSTEAAGIQVFLEQQSGIIAVMRGPKKLKAKERAVYFLNSRLVAGPGGWSVVARCGNCWF